ncbi:regulatory protein RecX [Candidatus Gottesmanbacteria bacterium]|nr:regulatory protein RecX [Candidatus Gottesmanbacteria bacterium]
MDQDLYEKLLNSSFRFVSYRPRSEKEIHNFLQKKLKTWKTAGQHTLKKVMERLGELGYIDDGKFAVWWVSQRASFRPKGKRLLGLELRQKGVLQAVIEEVWEAQNTNLGQYNELEAAKHAIAKKLTIWDHLPLLERKKKYY